MPRVACLIAAALLAEAACLAPPGAGQGDAPVPTACGPWSASQPVAGLASETYGPSLSRDGHHLLVELFVGGESDLAECSFGDAGASNPVKIPSLSLPVVSEVNPSVSADGQSLYLNLDTQGEAKIYLAAGSFDAWSDPMRVVLPVIAGEGPDLSSDGRDLYFSHWDNDSDLWVAHGSGTAFPTGEPLGSLNTAADETVPSVSSDGRDLYFVRDTQLLVAHRDDPAGAFAAPVPALPGEPGGLDDPEISADGQTLLFDSDGVIRRVTRSCH